jgi:hypothetical protein
VSGRMGVSKKAGRSIEQEAGPFGDDGLLAPRASWQQRRCAGSSKCMSDTCGTRWAGRRLASRARRGTHAEDRTSPSHVPLDGAGVAGAPLAALLLCLARRVPAPVRKTGSTLLRAHSRFKGTPGQVCCTLSLSVVSALRGSTPSSVWHGTLLVAWALHAAALAHHGSRHTGRDTLVIQQQPRQNHPDALPQSAHRPVAFKHVQ